MSSRSSWSEILSVRAQLAGVEAPAGAAGVDQDARQRHQAREPLGADRAVGVMAVAGVGVGASGVGAGRVARRRTVGAICGSPVWRSTSSVHPLAELVDELGRAEDPRVLAEAEHPGDQLARVGVRR